MRLHSDRVGIYGEREYVRRLEVLEIERSMSRASNPWDNAAMENFFNTERRHTTIGNASPIKHELSWQMRQKWT